MTDRQWQLIEPHLPDRTPRRGRRWTDHRQIIDAVLWKHHSKAPWRNLPDHYGPWKTVYMRYQRWIHDGTWTKLTELLTDHDPNNPDDHQPTPQSPRDL